MLVASRTRFLLRFVTAAAVGLALLAGSPAAAQQSTVEFTVSGTSTVRGWTCSVRGAARMTRRFVHAGARLRHRRTVGDAHGAGGPTSSAPTNR